MYQIGQKVNVGYWGGFHQQTLLKTTAEVTKVEGSIITIRLALTHGYRTMFGTEGDLKELEKLYSN